MCGEGFFSSSSFPQPHKVILKHGQELEEEQEELAEHQPLEQEDLNFERWKRRPIPKRTLHQKIDDLKKYLWNAETNEFMGRSGKSWSELMKKREVLCCCSVGRDVWIIAKVSNLLLDGSNNNRCNVECITVESSLTSLRADVLFECL